MKKRSVGFYFILAGIIILLAVISFAVYRNNSYNNLPLSTSTTICKVYISTANSNICPACKNLRALIKKGQLEKCELFEYATWDAARKAGVTQLPTVVINGNTVSPNTVQAMANAINAL